jgi:DNA-directed RNA polymerase subunit beta'
MYTEVLSNLLKRSDSLAMVSDNTIINKKLDNISSKNLLFILFFNKNISKLFFTPCFDFSLTQNSSYFLNDRFFVRTRLSNIFSSINTKNIGLSLSYKKTNSSESLTNFFPVVKNSYIFGTDDNLLEKQPFAYSSFLSPYEGEILLKNQNNWNTTFQKNRMLIVTKKDFVSFNLKNVDSRSIVESESISTHNDIFIKFSKQVYKIDNLILSEPASNNVFLIGEFIFYGDSITRNIGIPDGGQVVHLNNNKLTIRKGQSIFLSSKAILHAYNGDLIDKNFPVVTLPYQKLKAGDIVQGIPKIEQFFEARITRGGRLFRDSIPNLLKGLFKRYKIKYSSPKAVRQSFYKIQQILVDGVQRVYRSQGVTIADKHIEIIVKQMTCKVKIINGGQTSDIESSFTHFLKHELRYLKKGEKINLQKS